MQSFLTEVFELLGAYGEKKVINNKYLKIIYDKHIKKGNGSNGKEDSKKIRKRK